MNERCPICYNMSLVCHQDENERWHSHCPDCGYDSDADAMEQANERAEANRETPLGEEIDGGNDHVADEIYDGGGWPGDGSGTDDLADFNANEADDYRDE